MHPRLEETDYELPGNLEQTSYLPASNPRPPRPLGEDPSGVTRVATTVEEQCRLAGG